MKEPGLISRVVTEHGETAITIHEIWDTSVPGCPYAPLSVDPTELPPLREIYTERRMAFGASSALINKLNLLPPRGHPVAK